METTQQVDLRQPKQLYMLFFAEMWERFSYYGMRALLILFMVKEFMYSDDKAYHIYGAYGALVYTTPFIGGIIADRLLGYRKSVMLGAVLMALGHFIMAVPDLTPEDMKWLNEPSFIAALAFIIVGNGFFKPNISSIVGSLYGDKDPRRDSGFTIFYMGVNLGAFLAPLGCGVVGEVYGWGYGFSLAGVGMLAGLVVFGIGQKSLGEKGLPARPEALKERSIVGVNKEWSVYLLSLAMVALAAVLLNFHGFLKSGLPIFVALVVLGILLYAIIKLPKIERERMFVILILLVFMTMFWAFFEQAGSSLTLFTDRNVDRSGVPTSLFQSVNPLFILLFGPVFSALWTFLGRYERDLSLPTKFALGILQVGLGFGAFIMGAKSASEGGMVSVFWLLLGYLLHTTGELCVSPVGLSMVTRLSPKYMTAMMMGVWYFSSAVAHILGGAIASMTSTSAYMEPAIAFKPTIGFEGKEAITYRAYETFTVDKATGKPIELKEDEKLDTTRHRVDTFFTEPVTVNVHVLPTLSKEDEAKNPRPDAYYIRRSMRPDTKISINVRPKHIDPFGDYMTLTMSKQPQVGTVSMQGDTLTYTPNPGYTGEEVIEFKACEKENPQFCDIIRIVIAVSPIENQPPRAMTASFDYYTLKSTAWGKNEPSINVLDFVYDPDGAKLQVEILQAPNKVNALVSEDATLNHAVTPRKTLQIYTRVFQLIMYCCFGATVLLLLLVPVLKAWTHEGKNPDEEEEANK